MGDSDCFNEEELIDDLEAKLTQSATKNMRKIRRREKIDSDDFDVHSWQFLRDFKANSKQLSSEQLPFLKLYSDIFLRQLCLRKPR